LGLWRFIPIFEGIAQNFVGQNESSIRSVTNVGFYQLYDVQIGNDSLTDISPLVENEGLGEGDIVGLDRKPLNETSINVHIPQLEERDVMVRWK